MNEIILHSQVAPSFCFTEPEIIAFVICDLGLTPHLTFKTLGLLNFDYLRTLPKSEAMENIEEVADDAVMDEFHQKLLFLFGKAGVGVELPDEIVSAICGVMFTSGDDFAAIHEAYLDLVGHGLVSSTFLYATDVLAVMQAQGLVV